MSAPDLPAELQAALAKHSQLPAAEATADATPAPGGSVMTAAEIMDREFFEMRALILQLAASLDRMGRSKSPAVSDEKLALLKNGIRILLTDENNRANLVQMLFSLPYSADWPEDFQLKLDPDQRA